jgi:hypothetical protein
MASHPLRDEWQQELRRELRRQRLPRAYIARFLLELDDHYEDLVEERSTSMGAARKLEFKPDDLEQRLGDPARLAVFAAEQYHARSFWGRHPFITFVLGPLPMLVLGWIATGTGVVWFGQGFVYVLKHWFGLSDDIPNPQDYLLSQSVVMCVASWFIIVFPPVAVGASLCRVARRNSVNWRWPIVACTLLALVLGFLSVSYHPAITQGDGRMTIGVDAEASARWLLVTYLPKFAVGMAVGLLLVKRAQQKLLLES